MNKLLKVSALLLSGSALFIITAIMVIGLQDDTRPSDIIIVFGNKVESSGNPSKRLASRLNTAKDLYNQQVAPKILVSGGFGKEGFDESEVMKKFLIENGIPQQDIYTDPNGTNTLNSITHLVETMDSQQFKSATLVSNYYHLPRAKMLAHKAGIQQVFSVHAPFFELRDLYSLPREAIAYVYYFLQ